MTRFSSIHNKTAAIAGDNAAWQDADEHKAKLDQPPLK